MRVDTVERFLEHVGDGQGLAAAAILENREDALLGLAENLAGVGGRVVGAVLDVDAGVNERAQHRLVRDDFRVVLRMGRRGHLPADFSEVSRAADRLVDVGLLQALDEQHQVDLLPRVVHVEQVLVDDPIRVVVKVGRANDERHFVEHVGQQQDAAEHGPFGLDVLREEPLKRVVGRSRGR